MKSPYRPITQDLTDGGLLITIKQAAAGEDACESTLKSNAKAKRMPAYQSHFGAPVMVLPAEVQDFLKARPDIASRHHPKSASPPSRVETPPAAAPIFDAGFPFPDELTGHPVVRRCDNYVLLRPLRGATATTLTLVAECLSDIARQLRESAEKDRSDSLPID